MTKIVAILSMLHERPGRDSATRQFRGEPVLAWTLGRLRRARGISAATVLCWEDQAGGVAASGGMVFSAGQRREIRQVEAVAAARRWADGWRGGLLGTCEFDRGFYGPLAEEIRKRDEADGVVLVDPAAGLVDGEMIDRLLEHAASKPDIELFFSQAAPGLSGVLVRKALLQRLAATLTHPGLLLSYRPDTPRKDPIADPACAPISTPLARTTRRFTLDSRRQIEWLSGATAKLNGELQAAGGTALLAAAEQGQPAGGMLRELVVELNTERATDPIYWPGKRMGVSRPALKLETARRVFVELAEMDDARLVLGGVGDPMLHDGVLEIIAAAREAGIAAISIESDFVAVPQERVAGLAEAAVDVVSVNFPAATEGVYQAVMGMDGFAAAAANIRVFIETRARRGAGTPLLTPTFVKCKINVGEMEAWYDHWLRHLGCAVISGASDYGGAIPDASAADMSGPRRKPCLSLQRRVTLLSDGTFASCEQDVLGRQRLGGTLAEATLADAWRAAGNMRAEHDGGRWNAHPVCANCKQWHRA